MPWKKSPDSLVAAFEAAVPDDARADKRKMFGFPCAFVHGQMFTGLFQDQMFVRLPESDRNELVAMADFSPFEPMPGRPMKEYVVVPPAMIRDGAALKRWTTRALEYAASLGPKKGSKKTASRAPAKRRSTRQK
jgi:TfoX/Sxy family transcriptional regulator of competence genes